MKLNSKSKILCILPKYFYGDKKRGLSIEYKILYQVLKKKFKKTFFFNSYHLSYDVFDINKNLIEFSIKKKPDFIFMHQASYEIFRETLFFIKKKLKTNIINWCSDDSWRYKEFTKLILDPIDVLITTDPYSHKINLINKQGSILSNWGILKKDLIKPKMYKNEKKKISFLGTNYMQRTKWISKLRHSGFLIDCYGHGWKSKKVTDGNYNHIINNSYLSLNFSESRNNILQTKARVFEIAGSGSLCLTQISPDIKNFFKNFKEIILFTNMEDLKKKINFILKNPRLRNKIALNGYNKCRLNFTYEKNISLILKKIRKFKTKKIGPNYQCETSDNLINNLNIFFIKAIIKLLLNIRIPKNFLRRFLFEIEWRLRGSKTYSKNGWTINCFPIL